MEQYIKREKVTVEKLWYIVIVYIDRYLSVS